MKILSYLLQTNVRWQNVEVRPNTPLDPASVLVVTGTTERLRGLNRLVVSDETPTDPVLVIGGGRVGGAAVKALYKRGVPVHLVEKKQARCEVLRSYCAEGFCGDAAEYALLREAGIETAPSVLLTIHDDATNLHLASYCRRLNVEMHVVSRITHERNLEAIHRAGADFVLSYATLGIDAVYAALRGRQPWCSGRASTSLRGPCPRRWRDTRWPKVGSGSGRASTSSPLNTTTPSRPTSAATPPSPRTATSFSSAPTSRWRRSSIATSSGSRSCSGTWSPFENGSAKYVRDLESELLPRKNSTFITSRSPRRRFIS